MILNDFCNYYTGGLLTGLPTLLPASLVASVANATTDTELAGISIAATTGERLPERAYERPAILYSSEMAKLNLTMMSDRLQNLI